MLILTEYGAPNSWLLVTSVRLVEIKKSIPDVILTSWRFANIPRSQSPPYEYIEGGDFRDSLEMGNRERDQLKYGKPCKLPLINPTQHSISII